MVAIEIFQGLATDPTTLNILYLFLLSLFGYLAISESLGINSYLQFNLKRTSLLVAFLIFLMALLLNDSYTNLVSGLFTFASVYFAFWLASKQEEEKQRRDEEKALREQRRRVKFFLGLIWEELRYNKHQLEQIKANATFYLEEVNFFKPFALRLGSIKAMTDVLKNSNYSAFISSGYIVHLENDEIFNDLQRAYSDIDHLKSSFIPIVETTNFNVSAIETLGITNNEWLFIQKETKNKLLGLGEQIAIAYRTVTISLNTVHQELNSLKVNAHEPSLRVDVLTQEDKEYLDKVIRTTPNNFPQS
ncbi:MAG TPA: hypothetical protein VF209_02750 [Patescibacteria group bacterium]